MSDAFTAFYTTIMATAAVLDAKYKDQRRKELDRKIIEAKDGLAELMEAPAAHELAQAAEARFTAPYPAAARQQLDTLEVLNSICLKPEVLLQERAKADHRRYRREFLERSLGLPKEKIWWTTPPRMMEVEEFLAIEESRPEIPQREPASSVQIERMTEMIDDLVDRLLVEAYRDEGDEVSQAPISLDSGWNAIRMLRSDGYPRYGDPSINFESSTESRRGLNAVNRKIMADWDALRKAKPMAERQYKARREHFIAKICYNVLISPVPPGIHNYNALISGFSRIGESCLAQAVVDSFLFKSHLRPTQMTLVSLLHHYRLKKDIVGFYSIVRRLTGHDPRGIGLRRRTQEDVESYHVLWKWAQESDVAVVDGFVIERATLDRQLLEALLDGLIDFNQARQAAQVLVACMRDNWTIGSRYLFRVVWMCVSHLDRRAAKTLVRGFVHSIDEVLSFILDDSLERHQSLPYKMMELLDLAEVGPKSKRAPWGVSGTDHGYSGRLNRLKRALWARITLYELEDVALCTRLVQPMLNSRRGHIDVDGSLRMMTAGTGFRSRRDRSRRRFKMLVNLDWLNEEYERHTNRARWVLFQALPPEERRELRSGGPDLDSISGISINKLFTQWSQYLSAHAEGEPTVASATEATAQERAQLGPSSDITQTSGATESPPAFAGFAEKLSRSHSQIVASA